MPLPDAARVVGVKRSKGIDDVTFAKVEFSPGDWQRVAETAPWKPHDLGSENRGYLLPDEAWWDPSRPLAMRAAQVSLPGGRVLNVGVDDASKPGVVVLYLMSHGT